MPHSTMRERSPLLRFLLICLFVSATLIPVISSQQQRSSGVARSPDTEFEGSGNPLNPDDEDGDVIEGSADEVEGSGLPPVVTSTASGKPSSAATSTSTSTSSTTTGGTRPSATNATKQIIVTATSTTPKSTTTEQRKQTVAVDEGRELVFGNAEDDEEEDDDDEDDYDDDDEEDEDDDDAAPTPPFNIREQPLPTATMPPLEPETTTTTTTTSKATAPPVFSTRRPAMTAPPPFVPSVNDEDSAGDPFQFMLKPGVLAAITGGAVVGVLLAILLVMFIVYRIRKKDEGSYSVDENNATPHYSYAYQKAATKEFYA